MDFPLLSSSAPDEDAATATPPGRAICHAGCSAFTLPRPRSPLPPPSSSSITPTPSAATRSPPSPSSSALSPTSTSSPPPPHSSPSLPKPRPPPLPLARRLDLSTPPSARANPTPLLLDGTWKQAKEMYAASLPFLSSFAVPVSLPVDSGVDGDSMLESELVVRKEPHKGCMSTMEAVARALRLLEPEGRGAEVEEAMVAFQAEHLQHRTMKRRVKMRKKKDIKREEEMQRNAGLV